MSDERYPITEGEVSDIESRTSALVPIEIALTDAVPGTLYGLRGGQRNLGWFRADRSGVVIISGFVDRSSEYQIMSARNIADEPLTRSDSSVAVGDRELVAVGRLASSEALRLTEVSPDRLPELVTPSSLQSSTR